MNNFRNETGGIDWRRAIPRLLLVLVALVLIVLVITKVVDSFGGEANKPTSIDKNKTGQTTQKTNDGARQNPNTVPGSGQASPSASNSGGQTAPASAGSTPRTAANSGNLADTGPGETVALFVVVTAAGTLLYHTYLRRQVQ